MKSWRVWLGSFWALWRLWSALGTPEGVKVDESKPPGRPKDARIPETPGGVPSVGVGEG